MLSFIYVLSICVLFQVGGRLGRLRFSSKEEESEEEKEEQETRQVRKWDKENIKLVFSKSS